MTAFWCATDRDVVEVTGPDALTYLHSQVSNDLRPLQVGQSCWAFLLQPTGKIDVLLRVTRTADETFVLDTDAGFGDVLLARVNRFRIRVKAEVSSLDGWRSVAVRSDEGSPIDPAVVGPGVGPATLVVVGWGGGQDVLVPADGPALSLDGIDEAAPGRLEAARVAAVWPAMGSEIEPGATIPAETGIADVAVSFAKGCYPGQELVERMDSRGSSAPRRLLAVEVAEGAVPGDPLVRDGEVIGTITTVAGGRGLAYVKRSAIDG